MLGSLLVLLNGSVIAGQTETGQGGIVLEGIEGTVEVARDGRTNNVTVTNGTVLSSPCSFQTKELSRVILRIGAFTTVRAGAGTEVEIALLPDGQTTARLKRGRLFFLHRDHKGRFTVETPAARTTVLGTEFGIMVAANATTTIDLFDGEVEVANSASTLKLAGRSAARVEVGQPPEKTAVIEMTRAVQWNLYYPAIINPGELALDDETSTAIATSLAAYQAGDLLGAIAAYPKERRPVSRPEVLYRAGLMLAVGEADEVLRLLDLPRPSTNAAPSETLDSVERGLRRLIAVVLEQPAPGNSTPKSAAEWLASSYEHQSRDQLVEALADARKAGLLDKRFSFALARESELEFSFGRTAAAKRAIDSALAISPRNAQALTLQGFLATAQGRFDKARQHFDEATRTDPALANGWLGRGLCRIHAKDWQGGLSDLQIAATVEPTRAILRSYLAKAYAETWDVERADKELALAKAYDPKDPTAWLYSALFRKQQHRFNEGIADLEKSISSNTNRAVYRSRMLLDQDQAVRGTSLATIYREAGMTDVSVREAARSVGYDYANYSAHLFLADSFDGLRDPARFNLRYETVWFNELLLANILAPVGAGRLSQGISAQEYSRLFESDGLGLTSSTSVRSDGIFHERASQFGTLGRTAYALDLDYQHHNGVRPNNKLDSLEWYSTIKQQITPQDTALVLVKYEDYHSGDNFQYYDPGQARQYFSFDEKQDPILVGAWHHEWSPGMHTMLLGGRLINDQRFSDRNVPQIVLLEDATGTVIGRDSTGMDVDYHNCLEIYSAELNQVCDWNWVTLSVGARYQAGEFQTSNLLDNPSRIPFLLQNPPARGSTETDFERLTGYGYLTLKPVEQLRLIGGLAYDQETIPSNFRHPPVTPGEDERSLIGPKAAFIWSPLPQASVRGVYTRSLGGVSLDESYRLEPTQLAGFPQAFRTLIPESTPGVGSVSAPEYETLGLALDLKLGSRTYAGLQGERLTSDVRRRIGVFTVQNGNIPATADSIAERLDFEEQSLAASVNQLLGDQFVAGASYKLTRAELNDAYPGTPPAVLTPANPLQLATLQQVTGYLLFNHPSGFFARAEVQWYGQHNSGYSPAQPGDNFFQENLYLGYRFPRGHGEVRLGILNLSGEDYRLNPLTVYAELPRERVFEVDFSFAF